MTTVSPWPYHLPPLLEASWGQSRHAEHCQPNWLLSGCAVAYGAPVRNGGNGRGSLPLGFHHQLPGATCGPGHPLRWFRHAQWLCQPPMFDGFLLQLVGVGKGAVQTSHILEFSTLRASKLEADQKKVGIAGIPQKSETNRSLGGAVPVLETQKVCHDTFLLAISTTEAGSSKAISLDLFVLTTCRYIKICKKDITTYHETDIISNHLQSACLVDDVNREGYWDLYMNIWCRGQMGNHQTLSARTYPKDLPQETIFQKKTLLPHPLSTLKGAWPHFQYDWTLKPLMKHQKPRVVTCILRLGDCICLRHCSVDSEHFKHVGSFKR